ncbi:hypothetical protein K2X85_00100 [bacterium]|nr:hypothetical protein [bacterium]
MLSPAARLFMLGLVLTSVSAIDAAPRLEVQGLRIGLGGYVKTGCWTPVSIDLATQGVGFQGEISLTAGDSDGVPVSTSLPQASIPPNAQHTFQGFFRCESFNNDLLIQARDVAGKGVLNVRADSLESINFTPLTTDSLLVLGIGSPAGLNLIGKIDEKADSSSDEPIALPNTFCELIERNEDLPTEWFAYAAADVLVISADEPTILDSLGPARLAAIVTWVAQGGHLVISVANQWQTVSQSPLGPLLPATITGVSNVGRLSPEVRSLESLAGDKASLEVDAEGMGIATLTNVRGWTLPSTASGNPEGSVVVRGVYGFGTVTLLAFNVNAPPFRDWNDQKRFWNAMLEIAPPKEDANSQIWMGNQPSEPDISLWIDNLLQYFPTVTVVPFSWVAMLIICYILLIGPIDYFFLKRVIGKLEWTWITFPLLVLLVSAGAYYAAHRLKGDKLLVNRVELLDIDQTSQSLRGESFVSIFSPNINRYSITSEPRLAAAGLWSEVIGSRASLDRISSSVGRMAAGNNYGSTAATGIFGGQSYAYSSPDPTTVLGAPIPVWSAKSFTSQWLAKAAPALDAKLQSGNINEPTLLVGSLTNLLEVPIEHAFLLWSDYAFELGNLAPGQTVVLDSTMQKTLATLQGTFSDSILTNGATGNNISINGVPPSPNSPEAATAFLLKLSLSPRKKTGDQDKLANVFLDHWSLRSHARLGRAILIGQTPGPASKLWINEKPTPGEEPSPISADVRQTTLIRIILETKPAGAAAP